MGAWRLILDRANHAIWSSGAETQQLDVQRRAGAALRLSNQALHKRGVGRRKNGRHRNVVARCG